MAYRRLALFLQASPIATVLMSKTPSVIESRYQHQRNGWTGRSGLLYLCRTVHCFGGYALTRGRENDY